MSKERNAISAEFLRSKYFGSSSSFACKEGRVLARSEALTPAAKFVAAETKKFLGQRIIQQQGELPREKEIFQIVRGIEEAEAEELSERERTAVVSLICSSLDHYDILTNLVENPEVNDIIISSFNDISVQSGRRNIQTDLSFADEEAYRSFVENLLKRAGKACTLGTPVIDAAIDPHIRACVTHESFSPPGKGPMLTLRIARHTNIGLEGLVQHELAPRLMLDYLGALVETGKSTLLIAGEVGTGKTTLVKALANSIKGDEATLIIEDTHEIALERLFVRTLLTREANTEGAGKITPAQAIRTGMRMAMNRIILGEMRDGDAAEAFVDVCASGHAGMSTIHARSARDAMARLELFLLRAQKGVGIEAVRRQIANAVSVIVYLGLDQIHGKRRMYSVVEVGSAADGQIQFSPIFSYSPVEGFPEWSRDSGMSNFAEKLSELGVRLPRPGERLSLEAEVMYNSYNQS